MKRGTDRPGFMRILYRQEVWPSRLPLNLGDPKIGPVLNCCWRFPFSSSFPATFAQQAHYPLLHWKLPHYLLSCFLFWSHRVPKKKRKRKEKSKGVAILAAEDCNLWGVSYDCPSWGSECLATVHFLWLLEHDAASRR